MKRQVLMMLSCGLLLVAASPTWARTWTDNTGEYSVEAELVSNQGGQVTLRKPDGSVVVLPIARLSEADRRYLESLDVGAEQPSEPAMSGPKVSGKIHGQDFTPDRVELNGKILTLRQGKDFFPDLEVKVFLRETPEGRTYNVTAKTGFDSPHVHMKWREPGNSLPKTEMFFDGYVMKLQIGRASRGKLPGKIDLRLPDKARSVVAGTFTIVMPGETSEPGTGEIGGKIMLPPSSKGLYIHVGCLGRNSEGKLEGPATGFKLEGSTTSATATYWKPRNSILSWDQKTKSLTHKHVNRPPGWYLVYVRGNRRDLPEGGYSHEGYYDWKWVEIKEDKLTVTADLTIDPGNSGTVEVTLSGPTKESSVTYLPLDENGQLPFPDAHSYLQRTSGAKIEGPKAVIRGLREGKYQVAMGPWKGGTLLPNIKADVEVKRGSTTKVEWTLIVDLQVTDVYLTERGYVRARVKNSGTAPATEVLVAFFIDGRRQSTCGPTNLDSGTESGASSQKLPPGTHVVKVVVDPVDTIPESDETNNSKEVTLSSP